MRKTNKQLEENINEALRFLKLCDTEKSLFFKKIGYYDITDYVKERLIKILKK